MATSTRRRTPKQVEKLLSNYLDVCNRAIAENRNKFWFMAAKQLNGVLFGGENFHTLVIGEDGREVLGEFTLHFNADDEERPLSLLAPGDHESVFSWRAPIAYLEEVVHERPDWYVAHPLQLDWAWMRHRASQATRKIDTGWLVTGLVLGAAATALVMHAGSKGRGKGPLSLR